MKNVNYEFYDNQIVISSNGEPEFGSSEDLVESELFREILTRFIDELVRKESEFLQLFPDVLRDQKIKLMSKVLKELSSKNTRRIIKERPELEVFFNDTYGLRRFWSELYNYWRGYDRYFVYYSELNDIQHENYRPYTTFKNTIEKLNDLVRKLHRDIGKNITNIHPRVYRQLPGCCKIGLITTKGSWKNVYRELKDICFIRQLLLVQPLIIYPPMNKRKGEFKKVDTNPMEKVKIDDREWLCYPAKVGDLIVYAYFHKRFMELGTALVNLFWLCDEEDLKKKPDAIFLFGVDPKIAECYQSNTAFYDDEENDILIGVVPNLDETGYFGYLKKMMLTLHNVKVMKRGRLPVHGAMIRIELRNRGTNPKMKPGLVAGDGPVNKKKTVNVIVWGDTGTGKSETIEALRVLGEDYVNNITIIFDDMGSLEITRDGVKGFGTETGAFIRLDDLQPGFALTNVDKSIIMDPLKTNARAVLPVTSYKDVVHGYNVDMVLYANNYQQNEKLLEKFDNYEEAIKVFRKGARFAKGTTDEKGIVESFYANIFGPAQYKKSYDKLARTFFEELHKREIYIGELKTRLGLEGFETKGPIEAAKELLNVISKF